MSRILIIMRHGKAEQQAATDFDRPLTARGRSDVPLMAAWLKQRGYTPRYIIASSAQRTRDTAELVAEYFGIPAEKIYFEQKIYQAVTGDLLKLLAQTPASVSPIMLVGHNPTLEHLLRYLVIPETDTREEKSMSTAAVAVLKLSEDWRKLQREDGRLVAFQRPKSLRD